MAQIDSADLSRGMCIDYEDDARGTVECNYCSAEGYMFYDSSREDNEDWLGKAATHLLENHAAEVVARKS